MRESQVPANHNHACSWKRNRGTQATVVTAPRNPFGGASGLRTRLRPSRVFLDLVVFIGVAWMAVALFGGLLLGFPDFSNPADVVGYFGFTLFLGVFAGGIAFAYYWRKKDIEARGLTWRQFWRLRNKALLEEIPWQRLLLIMLICAAIGIFFGLSQRT